MEEIVEHEWAGTNKKNLKYRVRWKGFREDDDEWLSAKELKACRETVDLYHRKVGLAPVQWQYTLKELKDKYGKVKRIILRVNKGNEDTGGENAKAETG